MMRRRLLLVEDSADDIELILEALEGLLASQVDVVRDGAQALAYLRREDGFRDREPGPPAAVILDLKLPKVSGLEVLKEIRASAELTHTPVVVLTSSREQRDLLESYHLRANAYVVKPVKYGDFIDAVRSLGTFWAATNEPPSHP